MNKYKWSILILLSNLVFRVSAEPINYFEKEFKNPSTLQHIKSEYYSHKREIIVHTPASYSQNNYKNYPVLYLLDGKNKLKHVSFTVDLLAAKRQMPEMIIVAISSGKNRQQDFTPNYLYQHSSQDYGDANNFTNFLTFSLLPYIDEHYRTEPYRIVSGHSRSGLFVINDLINQSNLFQASFAFSPALWPNQYEIFKKLPLALSKKSEISKFLYFNVGTKENIKMKHSYQKLVNMLENNEANQLVWFAKEAEDDSHSTTPIIGHYTALRKLYSNWERPWKAFSEHGLSAIKSQYELLSTEFGYKVIPQEAGLNSIGYRYLKNNQIEKAIQAFQINIEFYPKSSNAYDSLADALESSGLTNEAVLARKKSSLLL